MNSNKISINLALVIIVFILFCNSVNGQNGELEVVDSNRIPDILNLISSSVYQNFKKIRKVEGKIENLFYTVYKGSDANELFHSQTTASGNSPEKIAVLIKSSNIFSSDSEKEFLYSKICRDNPIQFVDLSDSNDLRSKFNIPSWEISILTPKYYLSSKPVRFKDDQAIQRKAVKKEVANNELSYNKLSIFDFRNFYGVTDAVWKKFPFYANQIKNDGKYVVDGLNFKVEKLVLADDVQYIVHEPVITDSVQGGTINLWLITTFSRNSGYNMLSSETVQLDGKIAFKKSYKYKLQNDIYIPSEEIYEKYDLEDGSLLYQRIGILQDISLNQYISEDRFTYKSLGLKDGDLFLDEVLNKKYVYQVDKLVEK